MLQRCVALKIVFASRLMPNITFKSIFRDFRATLKRLVQHHLKTVLDFGFYAEDFGI